jgi:Xaa-Pro aminopeptidase
MKTPEIDAKLIVASSERDANLFYATKFFAPDPFIYFQHRGRSAVVMNDLELDRARRQAQVSEVLSLTGLEQKFARKKQRTITTAVLLWHLFSSRNIRTVWVPSDFPLRLADKLRRKGLRLLTRSEAFFENRAVKTQEEIREIAKVQKAAEAAMEAGITLILETRISSRGWLWLGGKKLTAEAVKERIAVAALRHGCLASHTIVACGPQACDPHDEGSGPLRAHQSIILDIFPRSQSSGYWGDITRTVVKGRASEALKSLFQTVLKAQTTALKAVRAGVKGNQIHQAILDGFARRGYQTGRQNGRLQGFFHGTGHGVGLEIHEAPRISLRSPEPLKSGNVVTIEPGLYYPEIGGVRIEDLVAVTPTGCRNLTRFPKYLEI